MNKFPVDKKFANPPTTPMQIVYSYESVVPSSENVLVRAKTDGEAINRQKLVGKRSVCGRPEDPTET